MKVDRAKEEKKLRKQKEQLEKEQEEMNNPVLRAISQKKKKAAPEDNNKIQDNALNLIARMKQAYEQDNKSNQAGKPALKKLFMLDEVTKELRKRSIQDPFIDNGGIRALHSWLNPLPDSTSPNVRIL